MTGDTHDEPVTSEVEDLRQFSGDCTRGILDAIPQLPKPEARLEAAQLMGTYAKNLPVEQPKDGPEELPRPARSVARHPWPGGRP